MNGENSQNDCWIGICAGCGRTLISATWSTGPGGHQRAMLGYRNERPVFCTRRCRSLHEHDVLTSASGAIKKSRR